MNLLQELAFIIPKNKKIKILSTSTIENIFEADSFEQISHINHEIIVAELTKGFKADYFIILETFELIDDPINFLEKIKYLSNSFILIHDITKKSKIWDEVPINWYIDMNFDFLHNIYLETAVIYHFKHVIQEHEKNICK